MPNQYKNKIIYGGSVLIDLTQDTVTAADVQRGVTFHLPSGATGTGTCDYDVDSSDCTAVIAEVLSGKTFAKGGQVLTGTMPNRGAVAGVISDKSTPYIIPQGYHDGSGTVAIDSTSAAALIAANIREGIQILGITGTMSGSEDMHAQSKTVTPATTSQVVTPDSPDYNCLSQVTVNAISYVETDNAAGGVTVTIAG